MSEAIWLDEAGREAAQQLLEKFWILRTTEPDLYKMIKDREKMLKRFFEEKFGFQLLTHRFFIRLIKLPGEPEPWMGIEEFTSPQDYIFLCCILAFLEEKGTEEQFLLSDLTDALKILHPEPEQVDWTQFETRKSLVRVLQFCRKMVILKAIDGEESNFSQTTEIEVLYENTPQARYFLRVFPRDLATLSDPTELLSNEWLGDDENRGLWRRHRIYRKLFFSPCIYPIDENDPDFLYLKNYRNTIQNDVEETFSASFELYKDMALLTFQEKRQIFTLFPDNRSITDMVLHLASIVREKLACGNLSYDFLGKILLTHGEFQELVQESFNRFGMGWTKKYRELSFTALVEEYRQILVDWKMMQSGTEPGLYYLMPLLARSVGDYPTDYVKDGEADDTE